MRPPLAIVAALVCLAVTQAPQAIAQQAAPLARYVVVFTSDGWKSNPTESALVANFKQPPSGSPLETWTRGASVKHFTPSDPNYSRFLNLAPVDRLPVVVVQRTDGGYVYKASAGNLPSDAYALGREIDYYAGLDPLAIKNGDGGASLNDSANVHGRVEWLTEQDLCPDGQCPSPRRPLLEPRRPFVQVGPDSVELQPELNFSGLATPVIVGVILLAFLGLGFAGLVLILLIYTAYRIFAS